MDDATANRCSPPNWAATLRHPPTVPDTQHEEMSLEMIRRIAAAIFDLDSFGSVED